LSANEARRAKELHDSPEALIFILSRRLNLLSSPEVRQPGKAPNYSVNWTVGMSEPEIVDAMKGKEQVRYNVRALFSVRPRSPLLRRVLSWARSAAKEEFLILNNVAADFGLTRESSPPAFSFLPLTNTRFLSRVPFGKKGQ